MGAPTGSIFISYRRGDAPFAAHALYGRLARRFPEDRIFMDVEGGVLAGSQFVEVIRLAIDRCDVLIALIGPNWDQVVSGRRRLEDPGDIVRLEIGLALNLGKIVVPALIAGASMPDWRSMPRELASLQDRSVFALSHEHFAPECDRLIHEVQVAMVQADGERYQRRLRGA